ncbi:protein UXT-like [Trichosurus vulpecula]|uniref:protein UXT-like n=1 Tax=Trichosurus vulpecula TaxID=9337 RepID=UPI00186AD972|nr:protein UXT-like [Trichosurus vulpecula]
MATGPRGAQAKILQYEAFISDVLQQDLRQVLTQRDVVYGQLTAYLQLKNVLERIQDSGDQRLCTQVDLGCNFYVNAEVPDPSRIFVGLSHGFFLELTLMEALRFVDRKSHLLTLLSDSLTRDSVRIKAHIQLVLEGLRELQGLQELPDHQDHPDHPDHPGH